VITVEPPSVEEAIKILEGLRDKYEAHHRIKITDKALEAAVKLSERYISGRHLPDKAIDLIDEAGAKARLSVTTAPPYLKKLEKDIEEVSKEKEAAVRAQDFEKAANLRDKERKAKEELSRAKENWKKSKVEVEIEIKDSDIAQIVSKWTGVPITTLKEEETERLLKMEEEIHERVVGQDETVRIIARALRRARAGLKDAKRPIGSFIFMGPTGVGKTLLARALAKFMFGDEDAIVQLDMSEYMEKFNVSRLVGAPPGYVGYEEGGQLTERIRRKPYSVILLDEIEKAHPDVFNILLQVLEDGRLTDSFGRRVDFRNTLIIMTSNLGAEMLKKQGALGFSPQNEKATYSAIKAKLMDEAKRIFRPEFLNRVDDIIVFHQLTKENLKSIVDIELKGVKERLKEQSISIELTSQAKDFLIEKGFNPVLGARPLRRTIQNFLENPLAEQILKGEFKEGSAVKVLVKKDHLCFK
ncbi:MAG: ATP-dependent Clp protease ATP-binding subunit, partial [Candidatus Omnitrophota bacterium]|nr:ATP-dependent Clp protease ATP-binding subunit [Candidatus Omnitrophota bacterium]